MLHLIDLQQLKKLCKVSLALVLCAVLILVPIIDRAHAVAAVDDVAVLILLTILLSMGISLVLGSSETPDQFFSNKFPLFKQQHDTQIVEQTIGAWLLADIQQTAISLKDGILSLPKAVVTKAKEFISWLIPNPQSDSVHDFSDGSTTPALGNIFVTEGSFTLPSTGSSYFQISNIGTKINGSFNDVVLNDGVSNVLFEKDDGNNVRYKATNPYSAIDGHVIQGTDISQYGWWILVMMDQPFDYVRDSVIEHYQPGFYLLLGFLNSQTFSNPIRRLNNIPYKIFNIDFLPSPEAVDSAIIGNYNDISGIKDVTKDINGTTIIENQFQITSAGQALNPSGETLDDLINALRQAIDNLNQRAEVTAVTDAVAEAGTVQPDYGDFDLGKINLSGLGALLTTRFPFSIPWDLGRIFGLFVADPQPPRWEFDLIPIEALSGVDTTITLDLGDYPIVGQISRWFCIIDLCIGLCYVTKRLIWVA